MPATSPSAFISYSREDSEFALRLARDLKAAGASVWIDQLDIKPGAAWDNAIEDALIASPWMLLVLSPGSSRSNNVRNEISFALEQGKIVIPVLYKDCIVPLQLQRNNRIDFRADYARGLASLMAHLQVKQPNVAVLEQAAEDEAKRHAAWQAREAEAQRLREREEQKEREESERIASQAAALLEKEAAERRAHEAESLREKEDAERQARVETARLAQAEAAQRGEAEQMSREEVARLATQEAERVAQLEAVRKVEVQAPEYQGKAEQADRQELIAENTSTPSSFGFLESFSGSGEIPNNFAEKLLQRLRRRIMLVLCSALLLLLGTFALCYFNGRGIQERTILMKFGDPLMKDSNGQPIGEPSAWSRPFRTAWLPFATRRELSTVEDICQHDHECGSVTIFYVILGDPQRAIDAWQRECDERDGWSCSSLAVSYRDGSVLGAYPNAEIVQQDTQKAIALYQKACQFTPDVCYYAAPSLATSGQVDTAIEMLKSGCSRHDAESCRELSDWYSGGSLGSVQNPKPDAALAEQYRKHFEYR